MPIIMIIIADSFGREIGHGDIIYMVINQQHDNVAN